MNDIPKGAHPGGPKVDPLDVISGLAAHVAWTVTSNHPDNASFTSDRAELELLTKARHLLILNARHVPQVIDELLLKARDDA